MVDHHVDRPGVEAQQCVKLTGTNSSIGLIVRIACIHLYRSRSERMPRHAGAARARCKRSDGRSALRALPGSAVGKVADFEKTTAKVRRATGYIIPYCPNTLLL